MICLGLGLSLVRWVVGLWRGDKVDVLGWDGMGWGLLIEGGGMGEV